MRKNTNILIALFTLNFICSCSASTKANTDSQIEATVTAPTFTCTATALIKNGGIEEITPRQAKSNYMFVQKVSPKETEISVSFSDGTSLKAPFLKQVLRAPNGQFSNDLHGKGVIHDMYVSSGDELVFQYYISTDENTLYTHLTTFMYKKSDEENAIVAIFDCYR